ncbi:MAG: DUF4412 domain-containing protein [Capsulimonadaceae bacterium]
MLRQSLAVLAGMLAVGAVAVSPAAADVTLTSHMTLDSPQMRAAMAKIPEQYRSQVSQFTDQAYTIAVSGKKSRMDTPMMSTITDRDNDKIIELYASTKTYYVSKFDPATASQMLSHPAGHSSHGMPTDFVVTDTGKTSTLIGHPVHEYLVTGKLKNDDGTITTMTMDIWAAQDIGGADSAGFAALLPGSGKTQITGVPLSTTTTFAGGHEDGMSMKLVVTAINTDPIPASTFQIPDGFTQTTTPGMPGMGGMGGPGMGAPGMGGMGAPGMGGN